MDEKTRKELAKYLQEKLHNEHLPGFYFDVEDVENLIKDFMEKYYL